jgi:hypothetical protein
MRGPPTFKVLNILFLKQIFVLIGWLGFCVELENSF